MTSATACLYAAVPCDEPRATCRRSAGSSVMYGKPKIVMTAVLQDAARRRRGSRARSAARPGVILSATSRGSSPPRASAGALEARPDDRPERRDDEQEACRRSRRRSRPSPRPRARAPPATSGPISRDDWNCAEFSAMPLSSDLARDEVGQHRLPRRERESPRRCRRDARAPAIHNERSDARCSAESLPAL